jgi:hypothetical protein
MYRNFFGNLMFLQLQKYHKRLENFAIWENVVEVNSHHETSMRQLRVGCGTIEHLISLAWLKSYLKVCLLQMFVSLSPSVGILYSVLHCAEILSSSHYITWRSTRQLRVALNLSKLGSRDSVVCMSGLPGDRSSSPGIVKNFLFSMTSRPTLGSHPASHLKGTGGGLFRPGGGKARSSLA